MDGCIYSCFNLSLPPPLPPAFIEKNTWAGVEETYGQLKQLLQLAHPSRDAEERSERRAELPHPPAGGTAILGPAKTRHPRPTRRRRCNSSHFYQSWNQFLYIELKEVEVEVENVVAEESEDCCCENEILYFSTVLYEFLW